ncbi:MAG: FGGY family carbohydrate kinase [Desulfobacterales bacterium]|jgi:glycerol kinase
MGEVVIGVDVGSSSVKATAFDGSGRPLFRIGMPIETLRPGPGRAEHDPGRILRQVSGALAAVLTRVQEAGDAARAIGLACQRSSFLVWERGTGRALTPVISWQDLRAESICRGLAPKRRIVAEKTGLPLTAHYGGPKFVWLCRHEPDFVRRVCRPGAVFSPLSSFLLRHLTGETEPVVDESIAGRTLLLNLRTRIWDPELLDLFEVPGHLLPEIVPVCHVYGAYRFGDRLIPITCCIGDQQAALAGLCGTGRGGCVISLGTSGSVLVNIGSSPTAVPGLLTGVAVSTADTVAYAAEGTVNAVGALFRWFEEEQQIAGAATGWSRMAAASSRGWIMLPGMYGIAAPYWKESAPTLFDGGSGRPEPAVRLRAGIESIAFLVADIFEGLETVQDLAVDRIVAAGGSAKGPLLQCVADVLGRVVFRAAIEDATALGCAMLAGETIDFRLPGPATDADDTDTSFHPRIAASVRRALLEHWHRLLGGQGILPPGQRADRP